MKATLFMGTSVSYSDLADKLVEVFEGGPQETSTLAANALPAAPGCPFQAPERV